MPGAGLFGTTRMHRTRPSLAGLVVRRHRQRFDGEGLLVHHEVVASRPVVPGRLSHSRSRGTHPPPSHRSMPRASMRRRSPQNRQARDRSQYLKSPQHLGFRNHRWSDLRVIPADQVGVQFQGPSRLSTGPLTVFPAGPHPAGAGVMPRICADTSFPAFHCMLTSRPPRSPQARDRAVGPAGGQRGQQADLARMTLEQRLGHARRVAEVAVRLIRARVVQVRTRANSGRSPACRRRP